MRGAYCSPSWSSIKGRLSTDGCGRNGSRPRPRGNTCASCRGEVRDDCPSKCQPSFNTFARREHADSGSNAFGQKQAGRSTNTYYRRSIEAPRDRFFQRSGAGGLRSPRLHFVSGCPCSSVRAHACLTSPRAGGREDAGIGTPTRQKHGARGQPCASTLLRGGAIGALGGSPRVELEPNRGQSW